MKKNRTAILGCGPAGLLAAHAAAQSGWNPTVFSVYRPSVIGGAQYLHRAIPEVTSETPDGEVEFVKFGTPETYALKVYGNAKAETSWEHYPDSGKVPIWNMRRAYSWLWHRYESRIVDRELKGDDLSLLSETYDLVISAVPARALCDDPSHSFESQDVWITPEMACGPDKIVYNGEPTDNWYRASDIFGFSSVEYGFEPPMKKATKITKPLNTDCDCHPAVLRVGRYGRWFKPVLIHNAYEDTLKRIELADAV